MHALALWRLAGSVPLLSLSISSPFGTACKVEPRTDRLAAPAVALCFVFVWGACALWPGPAWAQEGPPSDTTAADTLQRTTTADSLAPPQKAPPDSVAADTQRSAASTVVIDTAFVRRYLPPRREDRSYDLFDRASPLIGPRRASSSDRSIALDSTQNNYILEGDERFGGGVRVGAEVYRRERYRANLRDNWRTLVKQRQKQREGRGGVGVNMVVPGGRESAFSTVFGKPQVDLRLNGQADINAGFKYRKSDQQVNVTGSASQLNPSFKQDLRLGITGTIGDKLKINVDWDTKSRFNYQNQVKLDYTGYEDEILQNVEAGNVSIQTPSQLISGGQSLFGIKSEFQLGNLSLTTIASQQEGQSNTLDIEGGTQKTEFDLKPTDYDENRHFFLGYYFRNNWNRAHENPTTIRTFDGFDKITEIELWKTTRSTQNQTNTRQAVAVVDLGEEARLLEQANTYNKTFLPALKRDQYEDDDVTALHDGNTRASAYLGPSGNVEIPLNTQQDLHSDEFKRLTRGQDYQVHPRLGYISLQQRLQSDEALAVAFRYRMNDGTVRTIGDFSGDQGGTSGGINADRLLLKLLRPSNPVAPSPDGSVNPAAWFLQLRNIYRLSGRDFTSDSFELDIEYQASGSGARTTLPEVGGQGTLLHVLGLDRVDQDGARGTDDQFDFLRQTINTSEGLIFFPYLQPFGERILNAAEENGDRSAGKPFTFEHLYTKKKTNAKKEDTQKNVYHLRGSYSGGGKQFYDLKAFTGLVEGSVEVTTGGGQKLQEGTDYRVDYQGGTVSIINDTYTAAGRDLKISYEQNSLANLQKKTLLGARADWSLQDQFSLGATVMRLSQKSPVDKFRIGQEPIQNTIWGLNGSVDLQPRWLTQAVDALPLVQTRAESKLSLSGEFAQLRPGHTTTDAFQRTVDRVKDSETDSYGADELSGVSYIDDFEGFENTLSLRENLSAWQIAAAPDSTADAPGLGGDVPGTYDDNRKRTHWRGSFGWYRLNENILENLSGTFTPKGDPEATELIKTKEVFVGRDTQGEANPTLRTLDFYFDPWERGAYNYTENLGAFFREPRKVWGGITRSLPEGYNDFSVQNVEFVEFIVKVYPQNGQITDGARLFVNLGTISEDVVPNQRIDTEDGLSLTFNEGDLGTLSRIPNAEPNGNVDLQGERTQDLGLDGLVSYTDSPYNRQLLERDFYGDFLDEVDALSGRVGQLGLTAAQERRLRSEIARTKRDPSADDYHNYENDRYYNDERFFPTEVTLQQRFSRYYAGHELNGFESQNKLAEDVTIRRGVSRKPDQENLDRVGSRINTDDNYFQYAVPLDKLDELATTDRGPTDYVVSKVGKKKDWYKVRIPVKNFTDQVGTIQNFDNVESIRMWTTGHAAPVTMRFASLELVGSQWRASEAVAKQPVENETILDKGSGKIRVASINNEEDLRYEPPVGAVVGRNRTARGVLQRSREQALLINVDKLEAGQQRGIFKSFGQGTDLLKYSNLRMYTHLHGSSSSAQEKEKLRENLRLFVRLGSSETGDYYEYEQPLKPTDVPGAKGSQTLWPEKYEMNLLLERLNQLKIARGQSGVPTDTTFTSRQVNLNLDFAPPETVLKIHGTPSLQKVQTIVVGVRHAGNPDASPRPPVLRNFELWVNELRVSGFDEQKGWAANANATINLADFVSVNGSFQRRTDGFGALSSTLNERERSDNTSWNVRADVNLDAFLPERQGWKIPVSLQVQSSRTIPRFDPNRGDVRVSSIVKQFNALPDSTIQDRFGNRYATQSTQKIRRLVQDSVRTAAETFNMRRTMTANVSKQDSDSWWMRKTIDKTSLNFSYLDRSSHNAQYQLKDKWGWSGSFQYQLSFGQARTVRPLGFLPNLPVLGALSNLTFNYVPRSISFTSSAERNATTTRSRSRNQQTSQTLPTRVAFPLREQQQFNHRRNFSFQYDPFGFLSLNFDTNTRQSFNDIASRVQTNVIVRGEPAVGDTVLTGIDINPDSTDLFFENPGSYFDNLPSDADITSGDKGKTIFFEERLFRRSELDVFRDLLRGRVSPRTSDYEQRFSATLSMGWVDQKALNWIDLKDVSYQSSFKWTNGSKGSLTGASVDNSLTVRTGVSLHPNKVWERFGFFQKLKKAQSQSGQGEQGEREKQGRTSEEGAGEEGEPTEGERKEGDSEKGEGKESTEEGGLSLEDIPLPNPVGMLRGVALMVLDIKDLSVNYNGDWSSRSSNVGSLAADRSDVKVNYSLLDALRGDGPPVGYRFGLSRSIDPRTERVLLERFQVSDALSNRHQFEGRTTLSPSQALQMDLSWNVEWRQQSNVSFRRIDREDGEGGGGGNAVGRFKTESGENSSSVWGFGSFTSLFEEQVNQLQQNVEGEGEGIRAAGDVALTTSSVATDFREAFLTGKGTLGSHGFVPFPTPGWNVRYSGFSDWPLLGRIVKSASLSHSYNAEYKSSFSSVSTAGDTTNLSVGGQKVRYVRPDFEIGSTQVSEQFQPLLGLNLTWPGDLQTSVEWNRQVTTYLRTAGLKVEEVETSELSGSISYRKRGLRIPLLGLGRLENQIQFSLTLSRSINDERSFNLRGALTKARENDFTVDPAQAEKPTNNYVTVRKQTTRLKITPELTYRLSDQVTANFLLEYEQFEGNSSRQPSYTRINGGFNVRVDITQN